MSGSEWKEAMDLILDPDDPLHANIRAALATAFQRLLRSAEYCSGKRGSLAKQRSDLSALDSQKMVMMMCPCKSMTHLSGKTVPLVLDGNGNPVDTEKCTVTFIEEPPAHRGAAGTTSRKRSKRA